MDGYFDPFEMTDINNNHIEAGKCAYNTVQWTYRLSRFRGGTLPEWLENFSLLHKDHAMNFGEGTGRTDFLGAIVSPSINQRNCCGDKV